MFTSRLVLVLGILLASANAAAQEPVDKPPVDNADLAQQLNNPVAALFNVPIEGNVDFGEGQEDLGSTYVLRIQPVIPFSLTRDWNVIWRTILPITYQQDVVPRMGEGGIDDTLMSFFASPKRSGPAGLVWGIGPVVSLPTASDDSRELGIGPTAVLLRQQAGWTVGVLANHVVTTDIDINVSYMQPFIAFTNAEASTLTLSSESTYDWERDAWNVPVNLIASQLVNVGGVAMQLGGGPRLFLTSPMGGAEWGLRVSVTFVSPR